MFRSREESPDPTEKILFWVLHSTMSFVVKSTIRSSCRTDGSMSKCKDQDLWCLILVGAGTSVFDDVWREGLGLFGVQNYILILSLLLAPAENSYG